MTEAEIDALLRRATPSWHRDTPRLAADVAKRAISAGLVLDGSDDRALEHLVFSVFEVRRFRRFGGKPKWLPSAAVMPELLDVARGEARKRAEHTEDTVFSIDDDEFTFYRCLDAAGFERPRRPTAEERAETDRELAEWAARRAAVHGRRP